MPAEIPIVALVHRFADFELDPSDARLSRAGETVVLQPKVFDALLLFVESAGRLVTREELLERLWPATFVTEESLTQVVRKLRQALGDDPQIPRFLETVPRRGYRFLPAVERRDQGGNDPSAIPPPASVPPVEPASSPLPRNARLGLAITLVAALALAASWLVLRNSPVGERAAGFRSAVPAEVVRTRGRWTTTRERETFPAISPDGRRYAFVLRPPGEDQLDLFAATVGGLATRLTATEATEFAPEFSADGSQILFSRREDSRSSVWRMAATGGAASRVSADGGWGSWIADPDGEPVAVAFVRREPGGKSSVVRARLDTPDPPADDDEIRLWSSAETVESLAVSPDGRSWAAVVGSRTVVVGPVATAGEPHRVGPPSSYIRSVAWERDGTALIADGLADSSGTLVRLPLDGSPPIELTPGGSGNFHPTAASDGSVLHAREHKSREFVRLAADLRPTERLTVPTTVECFDVAPDGRWLAVTDWGPPPGGGTLALVDPATGERRELGDGLCPAFSPDGGQLAFLDFDEASAGLWLLDLADGSRRRLAPDRGSPGLHEDNAARRPAWSTDGSWLAFEAEGLPVGSGLFTVEVATGEVRLVAPSVFGQPSWSPDGRWIAVSGAGSEFGFVLVEVASGEARRVLDGGTFRASPVWLDADSVGFLVDQASKPALAVVEAASGRRTGERRADEIADEPAFWGVFEVRPDRRGGWIAIVESYESDLYLLAPPG
jgi:Tol biopolymer transport system component/DNA-binding winged helix-turn-helix (wHTH) protein